MELRRCGLDDCTILEHFLSSVKYFQVGRYCISDRRTKGHGHPPFISDRRTKGHDTHPFISDRRTKGHNTPSLREGWGGLHITPTPSPREGSVDGWGKYGLRSSLLAFKTKWRKKGQKQVSPRQRLGNCSQPTFAQNGQKNYYSAHSLCHSVVVGCHSFAPLRGRIPAASSPPGRCPGLAYQCPIRGVNLPQIYIRRAMPWTDVLLPLRGVGSLTFMRICYPPESNIRILNPPCPAAQPRSMSAICSRSLFIG